MSNIMQSYLSLQSACNAIFLSEYGQFLDVFGSVSETLAGYFSARWAGRIMCMNRKEKVSETLAMPRVVAKRFQASHPHFVNIVSGSDVFVSGAYLESHI